MIGVGGVDLVVVDGPNLFNAVAGRINIDADLLQLYLEECFDIDLLALASLGPNSTPFQPVASPRLGIVIFHSRKPLGRGAYYLSDRRTDTFWARQGSNPNTSTFAIDIPGDQQDTFIFECSRCQHPNEVTTRAEKGIDTSIATYLMETLESWESVCLFSRDTDYAPLIAALRRKGKMVYVAVPEDERATALVRVAQSTLPLNLAFVRWDIAVAKYLMPHGILDGLTEALAQQSELVFAVDLSADGSASLGITHPREAISRVRHIVSEYLAQLEAISQPIRVHQRNDRLLILQLDRHEAVQRKLGGFSLEAGWRAHCGNMYELHQKVVELRE